MIRDLKADILSIPALTLAVIGVDYPNMYGPIHLAALNFVVGVSLVQLIWLGRNEVIRAAVIAALGLALVGLSACNTVKGMGRDIESVGEAGDRAM